MSTRSHVAIKENEVYKYIYNQHNSHIDNLGIILYRYYADAEKVKKLISLGNTLSIGATIEEGGSNTYEEHLDKPLEERGTVAVFRDINRWEDCRYIAHRDWEEVKPIETTSLSDLLVQEFNYIFDSEENKWYVAFFHDNYILRNLGELLHSKEKLEKIFSNMYLEKYLPKFYEKCLKS